MYVTNPASLGPRKPRVAGDGNVTNGGVNPDTLNMIPYLDHPELKFGEKESTEMPFRYVKGKDGKPIMPEVSQTPSSVLTTD